MNKVYLALGSSLGERKKNCEQAVACFHMHGGINVMSISSWYRSKALTLTEEPQPDYCNGVMLIETELSPLLLLSHMKEIEKKLGRKEKREKWEARMIDLDLLFYDDRVIQEKELTIPHPEMTKRIFVLQPLCDIAPDVIHPVKKKKARELFASLVESASLKPLSPWSEA